MSNDLVSIIMLSCNDGRYVEETVRSVLVQTYQNWELLFVAEQSDEALKTVLDLRNEETERKGNRSRTLQKIPNNPVCC